MYASLGEISSSLITYYEVSKWSSRTGKDIDEAIVKVITELYFYTIIATQILGDNEARLAQLDEDKKENPKGNQDCQ